MHPAINVENLSKAYHIGLQQDRADTLVGALQGLLRKPIAQLRHMRRMNTFKHQDDADDIYWALKDVSFEVAEGEVVGIIGRNGAGKSTLLKILSRITEPTSGRAVIRGRVSSLLEVGTGFHQELSGRENVYMNGTILGMTKREIDRKFDEIVDFSGVEKFLDTPIKHYSSGMKVRLAFAVAAHLEPEILIIDEVLAVGDAEFQKKCLGKMHEVAIGGRTVLFVSHNMAAVESLCQTGIELNRGSIVKKGKISEVLAHYRHQMDSFDALYNPFEATCFFSSASLVDVDGQLTTLAELGSDLRIQISFSVSHSVRHPKIGIGIDSLDGQRILTVHTPMQGRVIKSIEEKTTINCVIPRSPLAPGVYTVKVALTERQQELESVDPAFQFTVLDSQHFGEGQSYHRGVCVAPSHWWEQAPVDSI